MEPLRVTHVVFDLDGGGLESLVAAMARRLHGSSVAMSVVSLSGRPGRVGEAIRPLLAHFEVVRPARGASMLLPWSVMASIRHTRADVVHLHSGAWFKGALAARLAGVPRVIYTEHGREHDDPPAARWLDRQASRMTTSIVAVSGRLTRYMSEVVGVDARKVRLVANGVDTDIFAPGIPSAALRASLDLPRNALLVGSIGRLEPVKAYDRLIREIGALNAAGAARPVACVIWGEGSERSALTALATSLGVGHLVRLPGWTLQGAEAHRTLDVFVLTSLSEGASVSLMESLASGVAPVVMDVGANAEVVGPALAGQVVPDGDGAVLRRVIERTLSDESERIRLGRAGRAQVLDRYSLDSMVSAYVALYAGNTVAGEPPSVNISDSSQQSRV